jgi:hypothetical protein
MYIFVHRPIVDDLIRVIYAKSERVEKLSDVQHDIVRAALELMGIENAIQIASIADIPAGTGLGSSSSYAVGLLHGLHVLKRDYVSLEKLAEEACHIEIDLLKKPIGKQDQYLAALGGFVVLEIAPTELSILGGPESPTAFWTSLTRTFFFSTRGYPAALMKSSSINPPRPSGTSRLSWSVFTASRRSGGKFCGQSKAAISADSGNFCTSTGQ